jgi:phosphate transport system substrate-binding protein
MKKSHSTSLSLVAALTSTLTLATVPFSHAGPISVDPNTPVYEATSGVSGNLNSIGSDTLNNLMTLWAEGFKQLYPNVNIQIEGKGSSTAPVALIEGTAQIGPMSRPMKATEIDAFEARFGYKPTEVRVAVDALAVYVNKDNPIPELTMEQLDGIFSSTRRLGADDLTQWGQVGLSGPWTDKAISLYGRNSASGTYGFFKDNALQGGDFRTSVKEQPGSSAVVQGVGSDLAGIGYSGIGYRTSEVRTVPLGDKPGETFDCTPENCFSGDYPLARFLLVYVNKPPGEPMDKLTHEFLKYVVSRQGQEVVARDGYFPLPAAISEEVLAELNP